MKPNAVNFGIAILVSALLAYGFYSLAAGDLRYPVATGFFCFAASTLCLMIGVAFERPRTGTNARIVCAVFFLLAIAINLLFAMVPLPQSSYVVTSGVAFAAYLVTVRGVIAAGQ